MADDNNGGQGCDHCAALVPDGYTNLCAECAEREAQEPVLIEIA